MLTTVPTPTMNYVSSTRLGVATIARDSVAILLVWARYPFPS